MKWSILVEERPEYHVIVFNCYFGKRCGMGRDSPLYIGVASDTGGISLEFRTTYLQ